MRMHIHLDEELVDRVDRRAGARGRSRFIRHAVERSIEQEEGLAPSERKQARHLFRGIRVVPIREVEAWRAAEWRRTLAAKGTTIAQADALIAAAALSIEARLATGNPKDFPFKSVVVEHWPAGR